MVVYLSYWVISVRFNSSDGRVVRASASGAVDSLVLDSESGQTDDFIIGIHSYLLLDVSINGTVWKTSRQVYLWCRWEGHLAGFPHLGVVDTWPATPKRARYSALIASCDKRINMLLNAKILKVLVKRIELG